MIGRDSIGCSTFGILTGGDFSQLLLVEASFPSHLLLLGLASSLLYVRRVGEGEDVGGGGEVRSPSTIFPRPVSCCFPICQILY